MTNKKTNETCTCGTACRCASRDPKDCVCGPTCNCGPGCACPPASCGCKERGEQR